MKRLVADDVFFLLVVVCWVVKTAVVCRSAGSSALMKYI